MRIILLRSNAVNPDSRVEKEVNSLNKNHSVKILAWDRSKSTDSKAELKLKQSRSEIYRFGISAEFGAGFKKNLLPLIKFQVKLFKWLVLNRDEYDVIHACDFDTALTGMIASKLLRKKLVYDIFDYYVDAFSVPPIFKEFIKKLDNLVINTANAVIICTEKRKHQIEGTSPKYLAVIHNTPDVDLDLKEHKNINNNILRLCYVGILQEGRFLRELGESMKKHKNLELHIGGFGQLSEYFLKLADTTSNVIFYGKLSYEDTLALENNCDVLVAMYDPAIRNHNYAAPNKFYEGIALSKPLIMAFNTGVDNYVREYNIGWVINYDVNDFNYLLSKLTKEELNNKQDNLRKITNVFSWSEMERRLLSLYDEI
ncbi:hypothetical protein AWM75_07770 [Aerococcus urinaehominis]|uniref:Uncharacterized protein n=1 Tax=Aerococcus urinaehominis TaxID=128944 RepID=A0A0X8FM80_9LACT|nr:glycosyltransferase [Aerococcus urinaehominis]AMB99869.1 hypothetical protein AWM75_07770 [Aerococcus urinaehominis]SDM54364.1 Glycosyltransferase involved in cell wall bisynthesis [Aerococcus urinaehominis]